MKAERGRKDIIMNMPVTEIPLSISRYCAQFKNLFGNEPRFQHFQEYITGLILSENVTVEAINTLFPEGSDASNLNRFLTDAPWSAQKINRQRLHLLQKDLRTRWGKRGVIAIDNTLNRHDGKHFDLIAKLKDHSQGDYPQAHDLVTSQYVGPHIQYPLEYRLFIPEAVAEREKRLFKSHTDLAIEMVHQIEGFGCPASTYTFDIPYTVERLTNVIESYNKNWVGGIKTNRWITVGERKIKAGEFAQELPDKAYHKEIIHGKEYWVFSKAVRVSHFTKKLRMVISYDNEARQGEPKIFVTNVLTWEARRVLTVYDGRWSVETFYRDSKQELGLDGYELRDEDGFRRHWYLVFAAYSCLLSEFHACGRRSWFTAKLLTIGEARRKLACDTVKNLVDWVRQKVKDQWEPTQIYECLSLAS
jgi:SRSO17 transposase